MDSTRRIMGDLITAHVSAARSDHGYADQDGKYIDPDTKFFCLKHPPFICVSSRAEDTLYGLEPPDSLVADWNREVANKNGGADTIPEVWEEINYEDRYKKHLEEDEEAGEDIFRLSVLTKHHDIAIICQDQYYQFCPRRIVYEYMSENGEIDP